jgi:2-succinyl-5-enolpyruvyl-6-hydroxy-3-cyclohexene-1-carboxylate synthase
VVAPRDGGDAVRILRLVDELFARATGVQPGPVHLNVAFRKPLLEREPIRELPTEAAEWFDSEKPLCLVEYGGRGFGRVEIADGARSRFAGILKGGSAGVIMVAGIDGARCNSAPLLAVAEKLKWPIIADVTSQLRLGVESPFLFAEASLVYEVAEARRALAPDRILHIGTQPVSHGLLELLSHCPRVAHCTLTGTRSDVVGNNRVSVSMLPEELLELLDSEELETYPSKLLEQFQRVRELTRDKSNLVNIAVAGSELAAVETILSEIPTGWQLYLANSLPIRLVDSALCSIKHSIRVGYHRGASGIDGTVAAACGFAHAECTPTIAIIGDLAAIHDVNSLILAARSRAPVVFIIINNGGGGIFSTLPDIGNQKCFEDFFITPQQVNFEGAAHFAGLPFERVDDEKAIAVAVKGAIQRRCSSIVEVVTDWRKTAPAIAARREIVADIIGAVSRND